MLGTTFLRNLLIALGCLLIIPGIVFFAWWLLSIQVVVLEGLSGMDAMRRSRQLMKGSVTTGMLLGLTLFVIEFCLAVAAEFIANAPLRVAADVVIEATFFVFTAAAWVVFYFSCRSKHERFDLAVLADAVGAELAAETTLNATP